MAYIAIVVEIRKFEILVVIAKVVTIAPYQFFG